MEWQSEAIVLSARKHGEGHAILDVLSRQKGRASGYVRGGSSRRQRPVLQPGNEVEVTWRGRLDEHLGSFRVEIKKSLAPKLFSRPDKLAALNATATLLVAALPEREPVPEIYRATRNFFELLGAEAEKLEWGAELVRLECLLLKLLGFGLDLEKCAATGETGNLVYVSPKSGSAVSREAGAPYRDRLLKLPGFLIGEEQAEQADIEAGLALTWHFISSHLLDERKKGPEAARAGLLNHFSAE